MSSSLTLPLSHISSRFLSTYLLMSGAASSLALSWLSPPSSTSRSRSCRLNVVTSSGAKSGESTSCRHAVLLECAPYRIVRQSRNAAPSSAGAPSDCISICHGAILHAMRHLCVAHVRPTVRRFFVRPTPANPACFVGQASRPIARHIVLRSMRPMGLPSIWDSTTHGGRRKKRCRLNVASGENPTRSELEATPSEGAWSTVATMRCPPCSLCCGSRDRSHA